MSTTKGCEKRTVRSLIVLSSHDGRPLFAALLSLVLLLPSVIVDLTQKRVATAVRHLCSSAVYDSLKAVSVSRFFQAQDPSCSRRHSRTSSRAFVPPSVTRRCTLGRSSSLNCDAGHNTPSYSSTVSVLPSARPKSTRVTCMSRPTPCRSSPFSK